MEQQQTRRTDGDDEPEPRSPGAVSNVLRGWFGRRRRGSVSAEATAETTDIAELARRADLNERALLLNLIRMREQRVEEVMIPRADIAAAPETASFDELIEVFRAAALTRVPIFRETLDDPIGFVHLKDLAFAYGFNGEEKRKSFTLEPHLRQLLYVPPSMTTAKLLERMQTTRKHIALVIDEYGGVDGLLTIEDLLEEIVGEIDDEHDDADPAPWREEAAGVWSCLARADIAGFEAMADQSLRAGELAEDVDTLGGFVFSLANRVPERGEVILHPDGHEFEVIEADPRRIKRLRVSLNKNLPQRDLAAGGG